MKCIIVDDNAMSRLVLEEKLKDHPSIVLVELLQSAVDALKYVNQHEVDLIFLDIHMPAFNGMDFIQTLKKPPYIIMTSSDSDYALQAFEYDFIVDYLQKPISSERLAKAISKLHKIAIGSTNQKAKKIHAVSNEPTATEELFINVDRKLVKIEMDKILFIEAKGDYIKIATIEKNYLVHTTLKKIEEKLPDRTFLKVHRSYIINLTKIVDIESNSILIDKNVLPVSRSKRPILMERLNLL